MKDDSGLPLKAFYALCNTYAELKDEGEITTEQFEEVMEILDQIEDLTEQELKQRLERVFPDYSPENIPLPGRENSLEEEFLPNSD